MERLADEYISGRKVETPEQRAETAEYLSLCEQLGIDCAFGSSLRETNAFLRRELVRLQCTSGQSADLAQVATA